MNLLKTITLLGSVLLSSFAANANVFQVNDIELKFNKFNAQKIRAYAVDVATRRGFEKLLKNIVPQEYNVKELLDSIDLKKVDVVEKLNIVNEVNIKGKYEATFDILYSQEKLKTLLKERRVPFIQESMGDVLLLAIHQTANQNYLLFEESNQFKNLLFDKLDKSLLVNPILAKGDLQEITTYTPQVILNDIDGMVALQLAEKYNTQKAILVSLQQNSYQDESLYQVLIKFLNFDNLEEENFIVLGKNMQQVSQEIAEKIKTIWQQHNLLEFNKPKRFVAMINTQNSLDKLYSTIKQLKKLNIVSSVKIKQLTTQYAFIQTDFYGTPQEFLSSAKNANLQIFQADNGQWVVEQVAN